MKIQLKPYVCTWPAPVALIGCGTVAKPNLITISWLGTISTDPPMVSVSIRPARFSYKLVLHSGEFTINIPRQSDLVAVKLCGESSGRQVDKFRELKLTPLPCPPLLSAPMIAESIISFGCRVRKDLPLGSHQLFIADIVSMYCEQDLMRGDGSVDPKAAEQLVWLDSAYWGLRKLE